MAIIKEETKISNIKYLIENYSLKIPDFQRPYIWNKNSVKKLFDDIKQAYDSKIVQEYRLGTIILFKKKDVYDIVDGQQRLITLSLLINILDNKLEYLFSVKLNPASNKSVIDNYKYLGIYKKQLLFVLV